MLATKTGHFARFSSRGFTGSFDFANNIGRGCAMILSQRSHATAVFAMRLAPDAPRQVRIGFEVQHFVAGLIRGAPAHLASSLLDIDMAEPQTFGLFLEPHRANRPSFIVRFGTIRKFCKLSPTRDDRKVGA